MKSQRRTQYAPAGCAPAGFNVPKRMALPYNPRCGLTCETSRGCFSSPSFLVLPAAATASGPLSSRANRYRPMNSSSGGAAADLKRRGKKGPRSSRTISDSDVSVIAGNGEETKPSSARNFPVGDFHTRSSWETETDRRLERGHCPTPRIFRNLGNGDARTRGNRLAGGLANGIAIGDVNGAGNPGPGHGEVLGTASYAGNGDGHLPAQGRLRDGSVGLRSRDGDLNADGRKDLVVAKNGCCLEGLRSLLQTSRTVPSRRESTTPRARAGGVAIGDVGGNGGRTS